MLKGYLTLGILGGGWGGGFVRVDGEDDIVGEGGGGGDGGGGGGGGSSGGEGYCKGGSSDCCKSVLLKSLLRMQVFGLLTVTY